jgi:hypothetical protein
MPKLIIVPGANIRDPALLPKSALLRGESPG